MAKQIRKVPTPLHPQETPNVRLLGLLPIPLNHMYAMAVEPNETIDNSDAPKHRRPYTCEHLKKSHLSLLNDAKQYSAAIKTSVTDLVYTM